MDNSSVKIQPSNEEIDLSRIQAFAWSAAVAVVATLGVLCNAITLRMARKMRITNIWVLSLIGCLVVGPTKLVATWICYWKIETQADITELLGSCLVTYLETVSALNMALASVVAFCRRPQVRRRLEYTAITISHVMGFVGAYITFITITGINKTASCSDPRKKVTIWHRFIAVFCLLSTALAALLQSRKSTFKTRCRGQKEIANPECSEAVDKLNNVDQDSIIVISSSKPSQSSNRRKSKTSSRMSEEEDHQKNNFQGNKKSCRRHTVANIGLPFNHSIRSKLELSAKDGYFLGSGKRANEYKYVRKWSVDVSALANQLENPKTHAGSFPILTKGRPNELTSYQLRRMESGKKLNREQDDSPSSLSKQTTVMELANIPRFHDSCTVSILEKTAEETETNSNNEESLKERKEKALASIAMLIFVSMFFKFIFACSVFSVDINCQLSIVLEAAIIMEWTALPLALIMKNAVQFESLYRSILPLKFICYCNVNRDDRRCAPN